VLNALRNAFHIADIRRKILYTAALLLVHRLGSYIPVPGVNALALSEGILSEGSVFGFLNMFAGGALSRFAIFALGVSPYITASIVMQLLGTVIPKFEEMQKEGPEGRKKLQQYTRIGTVVLSIIQGFAYAMLARGYMIPGATGVFGVILVIVTLTAGTTFLMWLGEKITENGIGNGISLMIFTGIVAELPKQFLITIEAIGEGGISAFSLLAWIAVTVLMIGGMIMVQEGQRRVPVQYARRIVGRKVRGGGSTHIPLKINQAGVIPVIFASSILLVPSTIAQFVPAISGVTKWIGPGTTGYYILYAGMIIFFTYFYTAVTFNPTEIAENMKKNGGFIPGYRPGRPTAEYLDRILTRITLPGAIFLAIVALSPHIIAILTRMPSNFLAFGGTGLLIAVGVSLDTMKQIEAQLLMRNYEGFFK
jgi:preprotein translocase subunit SecY